MADPLKWNGHKVRSMLQEQLDEQRKAVRDGLNYMRNNVMRPEDQAILSDLLLRLVDMATVTENLLEARDRAKDTNE
jgi:hypothetical protein